MRRLKLVSLFLGCILLAAAAAALAASRLGTWIERRAAAVLARPVSIEEGVRLGWSLHPTLVIEGLRLAARPAEPADLARIGRLEFGVRLLPLLSGQLAIDHVRIADAEIVLAADGDREGSATGAGRSGETATHGGSVSSDLLPRTLLLERVRLQVPRGEGGPPLNLLVSQLRGEIVGTASVLRVSTEGELDGRAFSLRSELDSAEALIERRALRLEPLAVAVADSDLEGALTVDPGGPRPKIQGQLTSRRLDLPSIRALLAGSDRVDTRSSEDRGGRPAAERFVPDFPLDLSGLRGVEAELEVHVAELVTGGPVLYDLDLPIRLGAGRLRSAPITARLAGGELTARLEADAALPRPDLRVKLQARDLASAELLRAIGLEPSLDAPIDLALEAAGQGRSLAELLATVDGAMTFASGRGRIRAGLLDRIAGGLRELVRVLAGEGVGDWVELRCAVADLSLIAGVATVRAAVLETALARLVADGRIDLANERLDLTLVPSARAATLNLALPVRVRGTFQAPEFKLDQREGSRRAALAVLGMVAFPPAALAPFVDLGAAGSPCLSSPGKGADNAPTSAPSLPGADLLRRGLDGLLGGGRR